MPRQMLRLKFTLWYVFVMLRLIPSNSQTNTRELVYLHHCYMHQDFNDSDTVVLSKIGLETKTHLSRMRLTPETVLNDDILNFLPDTMVLRNLFIINILHQNYSNDSNSVLIAEKKPKY